MSGYIGPAPVPQATQTREAFTATSGQTTFNTGGYTAGFIDVYLNGVKLAAADYTATNGSDVVLAVGAAADDILETVAYSAFTVADQDFTGETTAEDLTVTGAFTSQGIDDNATSTAMTLDSSGNLLVGTTDNQPFNNTSGTGFVVAHDGYFSVTRNGAVAYFNRNTSDGDITEFRKDGTTVGSIGTLGGDVTIGTGDTGLAFYDALNLVLPHNTTTNAFADNSISLGNGNYRFKDLYLSGGVYLGGTGSANKLDDYEEGTWTLTCTAFDISTGGATYRVIGDVCYAWFYIDGFTNLNSNAVSINLPFTASSSQGFGSAGSVFLNYNNISPTSVWIPNNGTTASFYNSVSTQANYTQFSGGNIYGANNSNFAMYGQFQYRVA